MRGTGKGRNSDDLAFKILYVLDTASFKGYDIDTSRMKSKNCFGLKTVIKGLKHSRDKADGNVSLIQFTAPISPGSSGGALFDDSGNVIGITTSSLTSGQNINLAVHISEAVALYDSWDGSLTDMKDYQSEKYSQTTPAPTPEPITTQIPAAVYDVSYVKDHSNVFTIDVDEDSGIAFVESTLSTKDCSFVHKYESDYRYSSTMFDVLVVNYEKSTAYPVPRLWITYCADEYLYYDSVTITLDGKDFTFSGISDPDWRTKDEKGVIEKALIKFGSDSLAFLAAMENLYEKYPSLEELMDETGGPKVNMVLHGMNEDISVTLGSGFVLDFVLVIEGAYINTNGLDYIEKVSSTTMTVN